MAAKPPIFASTNEKPYTCTQCEKKFSLKSTLNRHENTHTRNAIQLYTVSKEDYPKIKPRDT